MTNGQHRPMVAVLRFAVRFAGVPAALISVGTSFSDAAPGGSVPDFSSNGVVWAMRPGTDFTAVSGSPSPVRQDPARPYVGANPDGRQSTYHIADLTNPNLQQWVKDVMKRDNEEVLAGKIAFTARASCLPAGVPAFLIYGGGNLHFLQAPKETTIIFDGDQQVRHVYMDVPHSRNLVPSWYGESIGHYEGDTLVVDTIGQNDKTFVDLYRTPHTGKLHVVERWRLIDGGGQLEVAMTIEDAGTFLHPWQATVHYRRSNRAYEEEVCAEGNFHLFDYGTPTAMTPDF